MQDGFKMGDSVSVKLDCGHPNVKAGERCELCGKVVEGQAAKAEPTDKEKP